MLQKVLGSPQRVPNMAGIKEGFWRWLGRLGGSVQGIKGPSKGVLGAPGN